MDRPLHLVCLAITAVLVLAIFVAPPERQTIHAERKVP